MSKKKIINPAAQRYLNGGEILLAGGAGAATGALAGAPTGIGAPIGAVLGFLGGAGSALVSGMREDRALEASRQVASSVAPIQSSTAHTFAMGGNIQDQFSEIEAGGTHEQNPNGGVPVTANALLEEGEVKVGNKVFSTRLINPETGKSFADDAKSYIDPKRPNDYIVNNYAKRALDTLFEGQEQMKAASQPQEGQPQQFAMGGDIATGLYNNLPYLNTLPSIQVPNLNLPTMPTFGSNFVPPAVPYTKVDVTIPDSTLNIDEDIPALNKSVISPLSYAPLVSGAGSLAMTLLDKQKSLGRDEFVNNERLKYSPLDFSQVKKDITSSYGAATGLLPGASNGNAGTFLSNLQGLSLNKGKNIAGASLQAKVDNANRKLQVDQYNSQLNGQNQQTRFATENINQQNEGARTGMILNNLNSVGNSIGMVGRQNTNANIANNLGDYDIDGNYKMLKKYDDAKKKNPSLTLEDFVATYKG